MYDEKPLFRSACIVSATAGIIFIPCAALLSDIHGAIFAESRYRNRKLF